MAAGGDFRADQPGVAVDNLQRLWAPWRYGYVANGDRIDGCPFCTLPARGNASDRASLIVYRSTNTFVIFNAYPYNPGHLMVVPFAHQADLGALDDHVAAEMFALGRRAAGVLRDSLSAQGVNLGMNLGTAAGAGIADHLHLHVVPRWSGDTNFISVAGAARVLPRALDELYDTVYEAFADQGPTGSQQRQ